MKNIYLLPTEKFNPIQHQIWKKKDGVLWRPTKEFPINSSLTGRVNIYITSDEKLPYDDSIFDTGAFYHRDVVGNEYIITKDTFKPNPNFCKRVILTTDQDLIADGVQAVDDEFLAWFVEHPNCEFVEVDELKFFNPDTNELGHCKWEIVVTQEEKWEQDLDKPLTNWNEETLEEIAENQLGKQDWDTTITLPFNGGYIEGFQQGARWQAERMYSEDEVKPLIDFIKDCSSNWDCDEDAHRYDTPCRVCEAQKVLEQFKKK